jgi:hypothetical protein
MNTLARFRFHKIPFTRELSTNERIEFPHLEEAFGGLMHSVEQRMSAALLAPAGSARRPCCAGSRAPFRRPATRCTT